MPGKHHRTEGEKTAFDFERLPEHPSRLVIPYLPFSDRKALRAVSRRLRDVVDVTFTPAEILAFIDRKPELALNFLKYQWHRYVT